MSHELLNVLNKNQRYVCETEKNCILNACPGSGKTRTITYRLAFLLNKFLESRLLNIAITYTNRAAEEIENRLSEMDIYSKEVWTGTIHQFCIKFIIRPYSMYHSKLSKGYKIIDEFVKEKYITEIANSLGFTGYINDHFNNDTVMVKYYELIEKNKEIDFEKILEYSLELLELRSFIAYNISGLIRSIHVDEYQDTNEKQYQILSLIIKANKKINILFVGDVNQAIYGNLGGVAKNPEEIRSLFPVEFIECSLVGCYRSTQRIVDYFINYEVTPTGVVSSTEKKSEKGLICYDDKIDKNDLTEKISKIIRAELEMGISEDEICVVAPKWNLVYPMANKLRELLPMCSFDAPNITPIKYDPLNVFFLIAKILFTKESGHRNLRRKIANEILSIIVDDYYIEISDFKVSNLDILKAVNSTPVSGDDGIVTLRDAINNVLKITGMQLEDELLFMYNDFFEKINKRIKSYNLDVSFSSISKSFNEKTGIVINSIHGIKGEEYTSVVAFGLLNGHLPHWDYIYNEEMTSLRSDYANKLLYVLCSRAKKNIYLFSERGRTTRSGNLLHSTDELAQCCFTYD
jgi:DNA helicase-2/ATP-dependent DNA helicase PcrA